MNVLITGGAGFLGSNLAAEVMRQGGDLTILDNLSRLGTSENRSWLESLGRFRFVQADIQDAVQTEKTIRETMPDVIFHLAGQVAMTTSIENPRLDFETNVVGSVNVLESVRKYNPECIVVYSSTNKVYGDLEEFEYQEEERRYSVKGFAEGFDECTRLDFRSPYGCSKGAADQYMLDYARIYKLKTVVFRHSSIFGGRQFSTSDQGWIGWFVQKAIETHRKTRKGCNSPEPFTISGNGKQVRDVLFASDLVACYFNAVQNIERAKGQAFNIGGGIHNSLSLLELFDFLEAELDVKLNYRQLPWRQSDQKVFVADVRKAKSCFDWAPVVDKAEGLRKMIEWVKLRG